MMRNKLDILLAARTSITTSRSSRILQCFQPNVRQQQLLSTFSDSNSNSKIPFYGAPRPPTNDTFSLRNRLALAVHSATTAFADPTRADAVAILGELTGTVSLRRIHQQMKNDTTGRLLLQEKPVIHKTTIPYERLIQEAEEAAAAAEDDLAGITFGQAYGIFLKTHGFDPDARDAVKYIQDDELAYVMLRYRQVRRLQACST
jgi:hypothetical protein